MGKKWKLLAALLVGAYLTGRFLLPVAMPFLIGAALAALAEPGVRFFTRRGLGRKVSSVLCLGVSIVLLACLLVVLGAAVYRQAGTVAKQLPGVLESTQRGMAQVEGFLLSSSRQMPEGVQGVVQGAVERMFSSGSRILEKVAEVVLRTAGQIISGIPNGALFAGTAVLSAFMISSQGPQLKKSLRRWLPKSWEQTWQPALLRLRKALGGWLRAQLLIMLVTYGLLAVGLTVLGIRQGFLWAILIAFLDALPMIGTGIVLGPWALVLLVQGKVVQAVGMAALLVAAAVLRSAIEPKLLGKELGLHPLLTLIAMYGGFRLWGVLGMILSPLLAVTAKQTVDCFLDWGEV